MRVRATIALAFVVAVAASAPAQASFPGRNGTIAVELAAFNRTEDQALDGLGALTPTGTPDRALASRLDTRCSCYELEYSPSGRQLAVSRYGRIAVRRADGTAQRVLTRGSNGDTGEESSPTWSPAGTTIAFSRLEYSDDAEPSERAIYTIRADGRRLRRLTDGFAPSWSVTGWIRFRRNNGIYVMRPNGRRIRRISDCRARQCAALDWSPDGRRLAVCGDRYVGVMGAGGGRIRRIARIDAEPCAVAWSPDGRLIAFTSESTWPTYGNGDLFVVAPDGSGRRRIAQARAFSFLFTGPDYDEPAFTGLAWSSAPAPGAPTRDW